MFSFRIMENEKISHLWRWILCKDFDKMIDKDDLRKFPRGYNDDHIEVIYITPDMKPFYFLIGYFVKEKSLMIYTHKRYKEEDQKERVREILFNNGFMESLRRWINEGDFGYTDLLEGQ